MSMHPLRLMRTYPAPFSIGLALFVLLLIALAFVAAASRLGRDVASYDSARRTFSQTAFLPGATDNAAREAMNRSLGTVLSGTASDAERLAAATQGIALSQTLETEIDAIADARDEAEVARARLSHDRLLPASFFWERALGRIDALAERQAEIIADIRGLSYGANYRAAAIFERVAADGGTLAPAFVRSLNDDLPALEADFDRRANLYVALEKADSEITHALEALPRFARGLRTAPPDIQ